LSALDHVARHLLRYHDGRLVEEWVQAGYCAFFTKLGLTKLGIAVTEPV
jgi:hypothetical protein